MLSRSDVILLRALVERQFKGRYRRSVLGPAWAVLQPLIMMVVFSLLQGALGIPSEGMPRPIFVFSALVPWTFFSNAVNRCGPSISANSGIVKKMAMTREVLPLSEVLSTLIDYVLAMVVLAGMIIVYSFLGVEIQIGTTVIWLIPLTLMTALAALGVGFLVASLGTFKHDVLFAIPFFMQLCLLATPTLYPLSKIPPNWRDVYSCNPLVGIIEGFRSVLIFGESPDMFLLSISAVGICAIWCLAWPLFRYVSQYFADVL